MLMGSICVCCLPDGRATRTLRQKYIRGLALGWARKNSLRHFAHPSPNFYTGSESEIWPRFSTTVAIEALVFRNEATYPKSKTCIGSVDDERKQRLENFTHSSINFYRSLNTAKFGRSLACEMPRFGIEATYLKSKTNLLASMTGLYLHHIWYSSIHACTHEN